MDISLSDMIFSLDPWGRGILAPEHEAVFRCLEETRLGSAKSTPELIPAILVAVTRTFPLKEDFIVRH